MSIPGVISDTIQLQSLFSSMGNEVDGQRGALAYDGRGYHVIHADKNTFRFLSFREMIVLADSFKDQLIENPLRAKKIATELSVMKVRKIEKESKQNFILKLILKVVQLVKNIFKGKGLCTDVGYAEKVIKKLECIPQPPPQIREVPPVDEDQGDVDPPVTTLRERYLSRRHSTVGKKAAIEAFKSDPVNCSPFYKTILFRDIDKVKDLEDLICTVAETETVDFRNPWSKIIILEALDTVKREISDQIIEQLTKNALFNPVIYCDILQQIINKADEQKPFSLFSLELLMKLYMEKNWYENDLPLENPTFQKGLQLLIKSKPNENPTEQMIDWILGLPQFNFQLCVACITTYLEKIWEKPPEQQLNIHYPILIKLENHFIDKDWSRFANQVAHTSVKRHLQSLRRQRDI